MATPDLQILRRTVRDQINDEADPLKATVNVDLPIVVRSEPALQDDERLALGQRDLRVHDDYQAILSWLEGGEVPEKPPGIVVPRDSSIEDLSTSIALQRQLAERDPDSYLPDLVSSLQNLGSALANKHRFEEARLASEQAVEILRGLAADRLDAFEPDLAMALNNLSMMLSNLGRREEALEATQEAVEIRRRLAKSRPDAFEPELARSLGAMGSVLRGADANAAAACLEEGVRIVLPHLRRWPTAFAGLAGGLLRDFVAASLEAGREPDAAFVEEVTEILRRAEGAD